MPKQPNGAIDYTPRKPVEQRRQERVVFSGQVRQQRAPFFEVFVAGKSVEFTDSRNDAHAAFHSGHTRPRQLTQVDGSGRRTLLEQSL